MDLNSLCSLILNKAMKHGKVDIAYVGDKKLLIKDEEETIEIDEKTFRLEVRDRLKWEKAGSVRIGSRNITFTTTNYTIIVSEKRKDHGQII